jgi:hypothetical protein
LNLSSERHQQFSFYKKWTKNRIIFQLKISSQGTWPLVVVSDPGGTKTFLFRFCFCFSFQEKTETETKQWSIRIIWLCFGSVSVLFRFCFCSVSVLFRFCFCSVSVLFRFCFGSVSVRFQSGFALYICTESFRFQFQFQNRNILVFLNKIGLKLICLSFNYVLAIINSLDIPKQMIMAKT